MPMRGVAVNNKDNQRLFTRDKLMDKHRGNYLQLRPNTGVPLSYLQPDIVLCCGEDPQELLTAVLQETCLALPDPHQYRCYAFWPFPRFTLIWTGIGTGCLEPMLKEILEEGIIRRIVLIGSAGKISAKKEDLGRVYLVNEAYLAACAIQPHRWDEPLRPCWHGTISVELPRAAAISTDYYYGFGGGTEYQRRALSADARLDIAMQRHWRPGRLVEMETAQFYHLCGVCDVGKQLQFLALRGVANQSDCFDQQYANSLLVLQEAFRHAMEILQSPATGNILA